jgi:hypothetical protein
MTVARARPLDVVDEKLAQFLLTMATIMTNSDRAATVEELDLWVRHMGTGMKNENLMTWTEAVVRAGIYPPEYLEEARGLIGQLGVSGTQTEH